MVTNYDSKINILITEPTIDDTITAYCLYAESVGRYDYRDDELEAILYEYRMDV